MKHYEEDQFGVDTEHSYRMEDSYEQDSVPVSPADQLERYGGWLSSIPRDDVIMLRETPEYQDFIRAFERLGSAHRRAISMNRSSVSMDDASSHKPSLHSFVLADTLTSNFLQFLTADDVILRVFEFLECHSLIRMALTCTRFRQLAYRSATQRTFDVAVSRQLNSVMQLLRAKEQIEGVGNGMHDSHVRVPILLLGRRILVQDCGDPEMNGIYSCTSCNGNGFVFTKPRYSNIRVRRPSHQTSQSPWDRHIDMQHTHHEQDLAMLPQQNLHPDGVPNHPLNVPMRRANGHVPHVGRNVQLGAGVAEQGPVSRFESEVVQPGQQLRCIIAKRFSNEVRPRIVLSNGVTLRVSHVKSCLGQTMTTSEDTLVPQ